MHLTTPRLHLRPLEPKDAPTLSAYRSDPSVARFQSWTPPYTTDQALELIAEMQSRDLTQMGWTQIAVTDLETDALIGDIGFNRVDEHQAEVGFTLEAHSQGKGLMREALGALLEHAFNTFSLHRIIANTDARNTASQHLLERLGFRLEGVSVESWLEDGRWYDEHHYALLAREWQRV